MDVLFCLAFELITNPQHDKGDHHIQYRAAYLIKTTCGTFLLKKAAHGYI